MTKDSLIRDFDTLGIQDEIKHFDLTISAPKSKKGKYTFEREYKRALLWNDNHPDKRITRLYGSIYLYSTEPAAKINIGITLSNNRRIRLTHSPTKSTLEYINAETLEVEKILYILLYLRVGMNKEQGILDLIFNMIVGYI